MNKASRALDTMRQAADALFQNKQYSEARNAYRKICRKYPGEAHAWHMLSAINGMLGNLDEAEHACRQVLRLQPGTHGAYLNLANILMARNRYEKAKESYQHALSLKPDDPQILNNLGNLCQREGNIDTAISYYEKSVKLEPLFIEAWNNLGTAYRENNELSAAERCFKRAIELRPDYTDVYTNLANLYVDHLRYDEAESLYQKAILLDPGSVTSHCNLGKLNQTRGRHDEAEKIFNHALKLSPGDPETIMAKSELHEKNGNPEAAYELLKPLLKQQSIYPKAALTFARLAQQMGENSQAAETLEALLTTGLTPNTLIDTHFALGEIYDRSAEYDMAFAHFDKANKLEKHTYDADAHRRYIKALIETYNHESIPVLPHSSQQSGLPVYIVGMPRSGTSLVEQILASHPLVTGGGELGGINEIAEALPASMGVPPLSTAYRSRLTRHDLDLHASQYLEKMHKMAQGSLRFTDKEPLQCFETALIHLLLPNSHIIHCTRNPLDTCLSIYFHRFNRMHAYASNLKSLGEFYNSYQRLMQHWRDSLESPFHEVSYESLVSSQEKSSRSMIEYCELEWDDRCLRFYETRRVVNTPSYNQVRKPIYKASVSRWKHYEKHLGPLIDTIDRT